MAPMRPTTSYGQLATRIAALFVLACGVRSPVGMADDLDATESAERAEAARIALIERIAPAVVCIFDEDERGGGSGVLIDETGYGLTNFHVVASMVESRRGLGGLPDGKLYDLEVLGVDPGGDVAMFRLTGRERFPHVRIGQSDRVRVGDTVLAMGNPFLLSDDYRPSVSMGIVSGVNRYQYGAGGGDALLYSDCIQVDAAINPGNSGGPLFDLAGDVIGINGRISTTDRGRYNVGIGFAIVTRQIEAILPALRAGLLVEHGTVRAIVRDDPGRGVVFHEVRRDGPAWRIGIRPGDALLRFDGRLVPTANAFAGILGTLPAGWPVAISYRDAKGNTLHRITRTDPVHIADAGHFKVDPGVNLHEVLRTVRGFQNAAGLRSSDGTWQPGRVWKQRWNIETQTTGKSITVEVRDDGDGDGDGGGIRLRSINSNSAHVPASGSAETDAAIGLSSTDAMLLEHATVNLHKRLLHTDKPADLAECSHMGADRILRISSDDGHVLESTLLESVRVPAGDATVVDYQFDTHTHGLARVLVTDQSTRESLTIMVQPSEATVGRRASQAIESAPTLASARRIAIDHLAECVVKLTGAKVGRSQGYGSGIVVSADGLILTVDAALLDATNVFAVFHDGSRRSLESVYSDRQLQLALLRIRPRDGKNRSETFEYLDLDLAKKVTPFVGQIVLAAGNPFKVATGAERVSIAQGIFGGRIKLDAVRRNQPFPYTGDVLVIDAITSTPGFAGGALVDLEGWLLGMIGRVVEARSTHTMLNYAVPRDVLARFVRNAMGPNGRRANMAEADAPTGNVYHGIKFFELGYMSNPVYVERVRRGSPAARSGLRKDDLIIGANGKPVPKLEALERIIKACRPGDTLELTVLRNDKVRKIAIILEEKP